MMKVLFAIGAMEKQKKLKDLVHFGAFAQSAKGRETK